MTNNFLSVIMITVIIKFTCYLFIINDNDAVVLIIISYNGLLHQVVEVELHNY